jgi:hypothetical protein
MASGIAVAAKDVDESLVCVHASSLRRNRSVEITGKSEGVSQNGCVCPRKLRTARWMDSATSNFRLRQGFGATGRRDRLRAASPEIEAVPEARPRRSLAERVGVFPLALRNPNKDRHFHNKSHDASNLALADSFARFRLFASVCEFCQRNVTRNVTRRERLAQSPAQGTSVISQPLATTQDQLPRVTSHAHTDEGSGSNPGYPATKFLLCYQQVAAQGNFTIELLKLAHFRRSQMRDGRRRGAAFGHSLARRQSASNDRSPDALPLAMVRQTPGTSRTPRSSTAA